MENTLHGQRNSSISESNRLLKGMRNATADHSLFASRYEGLAGQICGGASVTEIRDRSASCGARRASPLAQMGAFRIGPSYGAFNGNGKKEGPIATALERSA